MDSCISVSFLAPKYWATAMLTPAPMEVQMAVRSQVMELVSPTAPRAVALMRFPTITLSARLYKTCTHDGQGKEQDGGPFPPFGHIFFHMYKTPLIQLKS